MTSNEIRSRFLEFFRARGHRVVRSSSLVPANDPTLLFSNAGMNQFKDVFLGHEKRDYARACSVQKCVRAGGKHNDLEQVGRTTRHHTFFEMLGNFSFGDYFKKEAIPWAWELVTKDFAIPADKLYVTVFREDDEAEAIWANDVGVARDRIFRLDEKDNFWAMGEEGPCGPCSEIHYDMGPAASDQSHADCPDCHFPCDCGRYVELWNLVFMQSNRICEEWEVDQATGILTGKCVRARLEPLPKPSVDTGAGLERLAAVLQGKLSNFDTDLFAPLIQRAWELVGGQSNPALAFSLDPQQEASLRIIADHARAATFLISDGVLPSNEGRGYVPRLIIRRALYHGQTLGLNEPFLYKMSGHVVDMMKDAYPELVETAHHVAKAIKTEEEKYSHTTRVALERLDESMVDFPLDAGQLYQMPLRLWKQFASSNAPVTIEEIKKAAKPSPRPRRFESAVAWIPGGEIFKLHDTFGLPPHFVADVVAKYPLPIKFSDFTIRYIFARDQEGYQREMSLQRQRARASWKGAEKKIAAPVYQQLAEKRKTAFHGYTQTTSTDSHIIGLVVSGQAASEVQPGAEVEIILDHTPFYAEAGGQVGDVGHLLVPGTTVEVAHVKDTYSPVIGIIAHKAVMRDTLAVGDVVTAVVDAERRDRTRRNHTGTHLLHAALRHTLGTHVKQAGSLVAPDRLRFDFTHYAPLDPQDLLDIEDLVNEHVLKNEEVVTREMDLDEAINSGAMALFGEKYGDKVRVVSIADGSFSKELCGGTHVRRTGDIGLLKIASEGSVAAGTRRIEALTGTGVLEDLRRKHETLTRLSDTLRAKPEELVQSAERLLRSEKLQREMIEQYNRREALRVAEALARGIAKGKESGQMKQQEEGLTFYVHYASSVPVVCARVEGMGREAMKQVIDQVRQKADSAVVALGSISDGKVALVVGVTKDLTGELDAGKIVKAAAAIVEGSGGGRKDLAEAGGKNPEKLDESLGAVPGIVEQML